LAIPQLLELALQPRTMPARGGKIASHLALKIRRSVGRRLVPQTGKTADSAIELVTNTREISPSTNMFLRFAQSKETRPPEALPLVRARNVQIFRAAPREHHAREYASSRLVPQQGPISQGVI
jgi:hypothetical protein